MTKIVLITLSIVLLLYPFAIYFGLQYVDPRYLGGLLIIVIMVRMILLLQQVPFSRLKPLIPLTLAGILLGVIISITNDTIYLKLNPVVINSVLLLVFARTLWYPPSMIETFARLQEPDLPDTAIAYTRRVTMVWCGFFICNGLVALYTVYYSSMEIWLLYNGFIAYILIGLLFMIEWLIRLKVRRGHAS